MSTQVIASATGKYFTTCKLCGKRVAESQPLDIPIVGQPGERVAALMKVLLKHLTTYHAKQLAEGAAVMGEFQAFRILSQFHYEDPTMEPRLENIRALVFQIVRRNTFPDEALPVLAENLGLQPADTARMLEALTAVRDACCEMGQYAPKVLKESKIVTV